MIEVASDSLRFDRQVKAALYARSGVPEYWIVNVLEGCVEVYRDPDAEGRRYRTVATVSPGQTLSCGGVAGLSIATAELF